MARCMQSELFESSQCVCTCHTCLSVHPIEERASQFGDGTGKAPAYTLYGAEDLAHMCCRGVIRAAVGLLICDKDADIRDTQTDWAAAQEGCATKVRV